MAVFRVTIQLLANENMHVLYVLLLYYCRCQIQTNKSRNMRLRWKWNRHCCGNYTI